MKPVLLFPTTRRASIEQRTSTQSSPRQNAASLRWLLVLLTSLVIACGSDPEAIGGTCAAGYDKCGNLCTVRATDPANCGACGMVCPGGSCVAGVCQTSQCLPPNTTCNGACVSTATDAANCGGCGRVCAAGQTCNGSTCGCPAGFGNCNGQCVDMVANPYNCGSCGNVCGVGQTCSAGACQCQPGLIPCAGQCINPLGDGANCGACGNACPAGLVCASGTCGTTCPAGTTLCNGNSCFNVTNDAGNCGACGTACATGQSCVNGACACAVVGQIACNGACINPTSDARNCGACNNACAAGTTCSNGVCIGGGTGGTGGTGGALTGGVGGTPTGGALTGGVGGTPTGGAGGTGGGITTTVWTVLDGGFVGTCGWSGYAFTAAGPATAGVNATTSSITPADFAAVTAGSTLCASGLVSAQTDYGGFAMLGVNIGQAQGTDTPNATVVPTGTGLNVSVTNPGASTLRVQIQDDLGATDATHRWCATITGTGGVIPWSSFNTACWDNSGAAYAMEPINAVLIMVPGSNTTDVNYNFCLNSFAPSGAGSSCDAGTGGTGGATGGTGGTTGGVGGTTGGVGGTTGGVGGSTGGVGGSTGGTTGGGGTTGLLGGYHEHDPWAGFAWTAVDTGAQATITPTNFEDMTTADGPYCVSGNVPVTADYSAIAMIGFNASQEKIDDAPIGTWTPASVTSGGLLVNVTNNSAAGTVIRVQIQGPNGDVDETDRWCATLSEFGQDVIIPWGAFNSACWDNSGDYYAGQPIEAALIFVPGMGTADTAPQARAFNFCVNDIGPDGSGGGTGGTGGGTGACSNTVTGAGTITDRYGVTYLKDGTRNAYVIQNNGWGSNFQSQTLNYSGASFTITSANGSASGGAPLSFPSIYIGSNGSAVTTGSNLPRQVSAITSAPTCLSWSGGSGEFNVAYDVWFNTGNSSTNPPNGLYLMVWYHDPAGYQPVGAIVTSGATVAGRTWTVWYGMNGSTPVVSYVSNGDLPSFSFDLKAFMNDAVTRNYLQNSWYLTAVMAGFEIWSSGTNYRVEGFSAVVN